MNQLFKYLFLAFCIIVPYAQDAQDVVVSEIDQPTELPVKKVLYGLASYYADKFHGRKTSTGEIYRQDKISAACNILPLGSWIIVTNLRNGKSVKVKTNDRLHPKTRRIVDLSYEAARRLGYIKAGLTRVKIEVLE